MAMVEMTELERLATAVVDAADRYGIDDREECEHPGLYPQADTNYGRFYDAVCALRRFIRT